MSAQNKTIELVATLVAKPGQEQALQDLIINLVPQVKAEEGCIEYVAHTTSEQPGTFFIYEIWASQAALDAHAIGPVLKPLRDRTEELLTGSPNLQMLIRIA